jgi:hypothetical protein
MRDGNEATASIAYRCSRKAAAAVLSWPITGCYYRHVLGRLQGLFGVLLLLVCIGAPIAEMFDRWDDTPHTGNDTEANLVLVAVCVGTGFVTAATVAGRVRPPTTVRPVLLRPAESLIAPLIPCFRVPTPNSRPPSVLRI